MDREGSNVQCLGVTLSTIATKQNTATPREYEVHQFAHQKNGLRPQEVRFGQEQITNNHRACIYTAT